MRVTEVTITLRVPSDDDETPEQTGEWAVDMVRDALDAAHLTPHTVTAVRTEEEAE